MPHHRCNKKAIGSAWTPTPPKLGDPTKLLFACDTNTTKVTAVVCWLPAPTQCLPSTRHMWTVRIRPNDISCNRW